MAENSFSLTGGELRRLTTAYTLTDPKRMTSLTAGDYTTSALTWSRSTRLAGLQFRRDFDLRPDLITMAVPEFAGSAAVPSSVEIYLNNARRFSRSVQSGPFSVVGMPVTTGADEARVVVTDENGNSTVTQTRFFVSDRLLQPGLLDYSFEAGVPRTGYGTSHDRYAGKVYGSASARYGLTNYLTFEGHAEGGTDLANGGAGVAFSLGSWGVATLAGARAPLPAIRARWPTPRRRFSWGTCASTAASSAPSPISPTSPRWSPGMWPTTTTMTTTTHFRAR